MNRTELLTKKNLIDAALADAELDLKSVKRRHASTGRGVGFVDLSNMQAKINRLKRESQDIQISLAKMNGDKREENARCFERAFVDIAKEFLPQDTFFQIKEAVYRSMAK